MVGTERSNSLLPSPFNSPPSTQMAQGCSFGIFPSALRSSWKRPTARILTISCLMFAVKRWRCSPKLANTESISTSLRSAILCLLRVSGSPYRTVHDLSPPVCLESLEALAQGFWPMGPLVRLHLVLVPSTRASCQ
jgi:hypothetical protein